MLKIDTFIGPLGDGTYNNSLKNGHTTFHLLRIEFIDAIVKNGMTIPSTAMIIIQEYIQIKSVMMTSFEKLKQPIFHKIALRMILIEKIKQNIFQEIDLMIGDIILTLKNLCLPSRICNSL